MHHPREGREGRESKITVLIKHRFVSGLYTCYDGSSMGVMSIYAIV